MNKWITYSLIFLVTVVLLDELIYKNFRVAYRSEHWSHVFGLKTPLQNWTNETGNSQLNTYTRLS